MSKPNPAIVEAIFDSYLTIRNPLWKLANDDCTEISVPNEEKARIKALTAAKCISDAKKCETIQDWVDYIIKLQAIESTEMKEGQDKWFLHRWVTDIPLLGHTLTAVRAYVLDEIKDEKFETSINHQTENAPVFKSNLGYHHKYFSDITHVRDHRGLNEKSFDDFAHNVIGGKRKADIAKRLLSNHNKPEQDAQRAAEAAAAAEKAKLIQKEEAERNARLELAAAEEERRAAEKARRENEERQAAERAMAHQAEEKARHENAKRRRAEELQRIRDEEKARERAVRAQEAAAAAATLSEIGRTPRTRRKSVNFDPRLFNSNTSQNSPDPMEIDRQAPQSRRSTRK